MRRPSLLGLLIAVAASSCSGEARTQITLFVDADDSVKSAATGLRVSFYRVSEADPFETVLADAPEWPATFALVRDAADEFIAHVAAVDDGGIPVGEALVWTTFASGRAKLYWVELARLPGECSMAGCTPPFEVCGETGTCVEPVRVQGADLPAYTPNASDHHPCANNHACGDDEVCGVRDGGPVCRCPAGYGRDDQNACVDFCTGDEAPECGGFGTCVVAEDNQPRCRCDFPHSGAFCDMCSPGWQLDGLHCEAECVGTCAAHAYCDEGLTIPVCRCALGYGDSSEACVWDNLNQSGAGIRDPLLGDMSAWSLNAVTFNETAISAGDGTATFTPYGACGQGAFGQTIDMPAYEDAQPFVVEVATQDPCSECTTALSMARVGESDLHFRWGMPTNQRRTGRACLPPSGYGEGVPFAIVGDALRSSCHFSGTTPYPPVRHEAVRIVEASPGECPTPYVIDPEGWTLVREQEVYASLPTATASDGTITLGLVTFCQEARAHQEVTFPVASEAMPHPALRFRATGSQGRPLQARLSVDVAHTLPWFQAAGTGSEETSTFCIPPWLQGATWDLMLQARNPGPYQACTVGRGVCGNACSDLMGSCQTYCPVLDNHWVIDDVEFVSDASCVDTDGPGFEGGPAHNRLSYVYEDSVRGSIATISTVDSPTHSTSGDGVLVVSQPAANVQTQTVMVVRLPQDPTRNTRPRLRFTHNYMGPGAAGTVAIDVRPTLGNGLTTVVGSTTRTEHTICLAESMAGQAIPLRMTFRHGGTWTDHYIDGLVVDLHESCR